MTSDQPCKLLAWVLRLLCYVAQDFVEVKSLRPWEVYKLAHKISSGAYGDAFAAENLKFGFECVVKTVSANTFDEGEFNSSQYTLKMIVPLLLNACHCLWPTVTHIHISCIV